MVVVFNENILWRLYCLWAFCAIFVAVAVAILLAFFSLLQHRRWILGGMTMFCKWQRFPLEIYLLSGNADDLVIYL